MPIASRSNLVLLAILTCQLMVVLDATVVNIALPHLEKALGFSTTDLSWVLNAYTLTFGGFLLLGARAGDLLGRRRVLMIGIGVFTLASLAAGMATTAGMLLVARAVQGLGGALASPSALALLTVSFKEGRERIRALAWYTAVVIGGSAVGMVVGGMLVEWLSWRWIFFINLPIGVALLLLAPRVLPETEPHHGSVDIIGALCSTFGMLAIVYGLVGAASHGWDDNATIASLAIGVVLIALFILTETKARTPITPLHLFASRQRSTSYVVRLLLVAGMMGMFFFLSQFLQEVLGYSALRTGLAFVPLTVALFAGSQLSIGDWGRRVPEKVRMVGGLLLSAGGLLYLTQLSGSSSYTALLASLMLFGFGNGLAFVPLTNLSLVGVDHRDAGAASGLVNTAQQLGGSLGLAVLVTVFGAATRSEAHRLPAGVSASARSTRIFAYGADRAFGVAAFLVFTAMLVVSTIKMPKKPAGHATAEQPVVDVSPTADLPESERAVPAT
jgi:EmrB/QacA subfamily drug resistance transporter